MNKKYSQIKFLSIEKQFHDNQAQNFNWDKVLTDSLSYGSDYDKAVEKYFYKLLGNIQYLKLLDIGSGTGNCALNLAKKKAHVTSIDISPLMIQGCRKRAENNNLNVNFIVMDANNMKFNDDEFDLIVGFRTIHHLPDLKKFYLDAYRILKKGGHLILVEPQKYNPFVEFGRKFIKNKSTDRTVTEHPLIPNDIKLVKKIFGNIEKKEFIFLSALSLIFIQIINVKMIYTVLFFFLSGVDRILSCIPFLKPLYWQVVLKVTKK